MSRFAERLQAWVREQPQTDDSTEEASAYVAQITAIIAVEVVKNGEDPETACDAVRDVLRQGVDHAIPTVRRIINERKN